jgi:DNA-directed RNA polymerase subunit beta'
VIVGRLIPAGTGAYINRVRQVASDRDDLAIAAQQQADAIGFEDAANFTDTAEAEADAEVAAKRGRAAAG